MNLIFQNAGLIGLILFFSLFIGIIVWTFWLNNKETLESYKFIIMDEKDES